MINVLFLWKLETKVANLKVFEDISDDVSEYNLPMLKLTCDFVPYRDFRWDGWEWNS